MFSRKETIIVIENQIKQKNNVNIEKYQEILKKINSMSDENLNILQNKELEKMLQ